MGIRAELVDELLKDYQTPEEIVGENGLLKQLTKAILERGLAGELTHHLGYDRYASSGRGSGDSRNGSSHKTLKTDLGDLTIDIPRDRNGDFEPQLVQKGQRRFRGFDEKILSMYARGMSTRDIQAHLQEIYRVEVSPELISTVTDSVWEEIRAWQSRPIEESYAIAYFDALWVKVREEGHVVNKAAYVAIGVRMDGLKEVLGIWLEREEGAKLWLRVITELHNRGLRDILIACVDGLKGLAEAIESVYPRTQVQVCIVHMVRNSLRFVSWKDRKKVASQLRTVYQAVSEEQALDALSAFEQSWSERYGMIGKSWRTNWQRLRPFFAYPADIRRAMYTTNTIESLNNGLRKVTRNRGAFPTDEAVVKLLYLAVKNIVARWTMPIVNWGTVINQLALIHGDRIVVK
jgi:putative transposase